MTTLFQASFRSLLWLLISTLIACFGGLLVFRGLWLEYKFGQQEHSHEVLVEAAANRRIKSKRGWKMLMWGIGVEIFAAGFLNVASFIEILQVSNFNPRNQPLATASAVARLITSENPKSPLGSLFQSENPAGWHSSVRFLSASKGILALEGGASEANVWEAGSQTNREWRLQFHENRFNFLSSEEDRNKILVKQFDSVDSFILEMPFPTNCMVESGTVVLTVNDLKWQFDVPRQKPNWGAITMHKVGNKAQIMRIPVVDWLYPPRFTNRWYDGQ